MDRWATPPADRTGTGPAWAGRSRLQNHEIRTPLVGVLGMADILLLQKDLPLTTVDHLRIIHESGNALLAIVNNILDLSKLNASMMHADRRVRDAGWTMDAALTRS